MVKTLKFAVLLLFTPLAVILVWLTVMKILRHFLHFPAPAVIGRGLDSGFRRKLQPPDPIIRRSGIKPGLRVLEVGCGSGAYTTYTARAVGSAGRVWALDIQSGMLQQLKRKLERPEIQDLPNLGLIQGSGTCLPLETSSLDLVYMITVLAEFSDQQTALEEVNRVLKPDGILAVTEFFPDPDYPLRKTTVKKGQQAGFHAVSISGNLWTYTVKFKKNL